jgi:hypothetical protein
LSRRLRAGERLLPEVGDRQPQHAERPAARLHDVRLRDGESGAHDARKQPDREPVRPQYLLRAPERAAGQDFERAALLAAQVLASRSHRRHCTPVRLSRGGCSRQFGRASAPMMPHRVHTMRGPNVGTAYDRPVVAQQHTSSERTPFWRMLPSVIGSIGSLRCLAAMELL